MIVNAFQKFLYFFFARLFFVELNSKLYNYFVKFFEEKEKKKN